MENDNEETSYKYVQGLSRGLAVLKALSYSERGRAQLADISSTTGLHRTTVRRLLETLKAEGFAVDCIAPQAAIYLAVQFNLQGKKTADGTI